MQSSHDKSSGASTSARFARELVILAAIFAGATALFTFVIYPAINWPSTAPMPGRSVMLALAIILLIMAHGDGLRSIGLGRPRYIWLTFVLAVIFIAAKLFALQPVTDWIKDALSVPPSDLSFFTHIYGNLPAYLGWLAIAWIAGGFSEEVIFRGYLLNRIASMGGNTYLAWTTAVIAQALLFGLGHYYQGFGGIVSVSAGALFSGVFYLLVKRNLWVLIIAHGAWDTLGITLIYLNGASSTS